MKRYIDLSDFTECRLIENQMRYADIFDFANASKLIKIRFDKLSNEGKLFYKYFVYAHVNTTPVEKNIIWDYLNGDRKTIATYVRYLLKNKNMV